MRLNIKTAPYFIHLFKRNIVTTTKKDVKIKVDDVYINYESSGSKGKVALCLPGSMGCIETDFAPQLKELGSKGIEALFWDPPGYGKSRPPSRDFSSNFFHNDCRMAVLLMKELGYDKYSLLGWSDGAITAIHMALNYPDKIEKLVVWGANGFLAEKDMKINEGIRDVSKWSERMRKPMEGVYGAEYFKTKWEEWVDAVFRIYRENNGILYERDLTTITCPTLIIHGKKDPLVGLEHADYLHERIKNSELVVFENGKHNLHLRYAQEFNDLVTEFLKR